MPITKDAGRQWPLFAEVEFGFADLDGGVQVATLVAEAIDVPYGACVIGGQLIIDEIFADAGDTGTCTIAVGDGGVANRYLGDTDATALGRTALVPTGYKYTAPDTIDVDVAIGTADLTRGKARLQIWYVIADRANEVNP